MVVEVKDITKQFYGTTVLNDVNLSFAPGEAHALVGENGAGKSTLIKIIGGTYQADTGSILIDGKLVRIPDAHTAIRNGISVVHQEFNLVRDMTVLENVMLGKEPTGHLGNIDQRAARTMVEDVINRDGIRVDLDRYAGDLSAAEAKIAEILKACIDDMGLLILDEPTAALNNEEVTVLFSLIETFKKRGVGIIYISHRIEEIFQFCEKVSVLKDGYCVGTWPTSAINRDFLIASMVGRKLTDIFPERIHNFGPDDPVTFAAHSISDGHHFHDVSFTLRKGEILGIGGMSGQGQREMIRALFGVHKLISGELHLNGKSVQIRSPFDAMRNRMAFLSDDRRNEGLAQEQSVSKNIAYPTLNNYSRLGIIRNGKQTQKVDSLIDQLNIKVASTNQSVKGLSGGNQQRVVLAKWLPLNPLILLFHEPTLGVDVGAKMEIYAILRELTIQGISIIMVTSDMIELLQISDRICVFYEGRIIAEYPWQIVTEELVMAAAIGRPLPSGRTC